MLLDKKKYIYFFFLLFLSFNLLSCGEKDEDLVPHLYDDPVFTLKKAKEIIGEDVKIAKSGKFDADSVIEIAAGSELMNENEWGIKFYFIKEIGDELEVIYESNLRDGSLEDCLFEKIKFPSIKHELIYYNSLDYFLGSGGGEIFSYVADLSNQKIYYAHLIIQPGRSVSLFLSDNIDVPEIRNFFISNFKRDYSNLKLIEKDIKSL